MAESRFLKILILLLLLINLGTLTFLWMGPHHHLPPMPPPGPGMEGHGEGAGRYLSQSLQLNEDQDDQYHRMQRQHHETVMGIRDQMRSQKQRLYAFMQTTDSSKSQPEAKRIIDSIAAEQGLIEQVTYDHFKELRALCTPVQQHKFDSVIGEALDRMR